MGSEKVDDPIKKETGHRLMTTALDFFKANPLKSLSLAMISVGFLFLLVFFARIRYMPDMALADITSVIYAVASLGAFISIYVMLLLVAPGFILSQFKSMFVDASKVHLGVLSLTSSAVLVVLLSYILKVWYFSDAITSIFVGLAVVFLIPSFGVFLSSRWPDRRVGYDDPGKRVGDNLWQSYVVSLIWVAFIGVVMFMSLLFVVLIGNEGDIRSAGDGYVLFVFSLILVAISLFAVFIAVSPKKSGTVALVLSPILLFYMLSATGSFSVIPMVAIRVLDLGEITAASLVVSGQTCDGVNQMLGQKICKLNSGSEVASICPVIMRSRIGSQVVLDFAEIAMERADPSDKSASDHLVWLSTEGAIDARPGKSIAQRVVLDKNGVLAWRPLTAIPERDVLSDGIERNAVGKLGASLALAAVDKEASASNPMQESFNRLFRDVCPPLLSE